MRKLNYAILLIISVITVSSCVVPKKKFLAMQHQRDSLQNGLNIANIRIDSLEKVVAAQKDTINNLRAEVSDLKSKLSNLTEQYNTLSENYKQLRANSTDEIKKLIKDLEATQANLLAREKRLKEVEDAMARRDDAVRALRDKLQKALLGFNKSGLTVNVKDGKVYVSLTDKLLFASGSIEIDAKGKDALTELAKVLQTQPDINILVEGHTDNMKVTNLGQIKDNWDLSVLRSSAVVRFLTEEQKLDEKRVTASGRGEVVPVDKMNTAEARSKNRRIEIILTPKLDELYNLLNEDVK
ncbi:MAG: OmpA family protein [bacterium]|jgi:chemotaxis protein MotB